MAIWMKASETSFYAAPSRQPMMIRVVRDRVNATGRVNGGGGEGTYKLILNLKLYVVTVFTSVVCSTEIHKLESYKFQ